MRVFPKVFREHLPGTQGGTRVPHVPCSLVPVPSGLSPHLHHQFLIFGERDSCHKNLSRKKERMFENYKVWEREQRVSKTQKKTDGRRWRQRWWPECGSASDWEATQPSVDGHIDWAHATTSQLFFWWISASGGLTGQPDTTMTSCSPFPFPTTLHSGNRLFPVPVFGFWFVMPPHS